MKYRPLFLLLSLALLTLPGCRDQPAPVARLRVEPRSVTLPYPGSVGLEATWEPTMQPPGLAGTLRVLVHLLKDEPGSILRTFDHDFPAPWEAGRPQTYQIELWQSALGPPLPSGIYPLSLGIYDRDGRRWPLLVEGGEIDEHEYVVARVEVPSTAESGPTALFSGSWLPIETGGSQQILAVRWLEDAGQIELQDLRQPVEVDLTLSIPRLEQHDFRLVLDEGAEAQAVRLRSDCLETPAEVTDYGTHEIGLLLKPPVDSSSCKIEIDPSFVFLHMIEFHRRSIVLEKLVWNEIGS